MNIEAKLNLDDVLVGDDGWTSTLGELVKEELKAAIKKEIQIAIKENKDLKKAIALLEKRAAEQIIASFTRRD